MAWEIGVGGRQGNQLRLGSGTGVGVWLGLGMEVGVWLRLGTEQTKQSDSRPSVSVGLKE